jgi:hypothetical protein
MQKDTDANIRHLLRARRVDIIKNVGYNIIDGTSRPTIPVPKNDIPQAEQTYFYNEYAGRPARGMDKNYGKKFIMSNHSLYEGALGKPS